jgi:hypothetical protein
MDAQPVYSTSDFMQAEAACEQLRAHGIKCGSVESQPPFARFRFIPPYMGSPAGPGHTGQWDVIVAPEDVERATDVLHAWAGSESADP